MLYYRLAAVISPITSSRAHWVSFWLLVAGTLSVLYAVLILMIPGLTITREDWIGWTRSFACRVFQGKKTEGDAQWGAIGLVFVYGAVLALVPGSIALAKYFERYPIYELKDVDVTARPQPFEFWMHYTSESSGPMDFYARFCKDYSPGFEAGDHLTLLRYEDRGKCWGLTNEHAGYLIRRDDHGHTDSENERTRQATEAASPTLPAGPTERP